MKKKVGVFGGSFDPVHFGHLNLAISLKERASLDLVLFVPARVSPFKQEKAPVASGEHRLQMLKLAIQGIEGFEVLDLELKREAPSYTIDTVRELSLDSSLQLHLLLAEDQISCFSSWKEADLLMKLAPPLIGARRFTLEAAVQDGKVMQDLAAASKLNGSDNQKAIPFEYRGHLIQTPYFDVSSTQIRERLSKKMYCGHLIPHSVIEYIKHHQLYE